MTTAIEAMLEALEEIKRADSCESEEAPQANPVRMLIEKEMQVFAKSVDKKRFEDTGYDYEENPYLMINEWGADEALKEAGLYGHDSCANKVLLMLRKYQDQFGVRFDWLIEQIEKMKERKNG